MLGFTGFEEYDKILTIAIFYAIFVGGSAIGFTASYGKFADERFGIEIDPRLGWFLMELPATISFNYFFWTSANCFEPMRLFMGLVFIKHYLNRGFYFPLTIKLSAANEKKSFSISVVLAGIVFTSIHGYLNAKWLGEICPWLDGNWLTNPLFLIGYPLYEVSFWATVYHEELIRKLRDSKTSGGGKYKIPRGGLFEYVTNATYFTELTGWFAWTLCTWSPAGSVVFVVSFLNLVPRAFKQQTWYLNKFEEYPSERKVIIPFVI